MLENMFAVHNNNGLSAALAELGTAELMRVRSVSASKDQYKCMLAAHVFGASLLVPYVLHLQQEGS